MFTVGFCGCLFTFNDCNETLLSINFYIIKAKYHVTNARLDRKYFLFSSLNVIYAFAEFFIVFGFSASILYFAYAISDISAIESDA